MRMASPPIRASLTSSTRMSRTVESGGSSRRAAHNRTASIAWRKVAYSVLPPQFTAHYARALGAARRGADLRFSSPPPVPRSRYRALRQPTGQHGAPGAGAQRLPRRARGALVALVSREGRGRRRGAQTVARLVGAGVRLHHDPPRRRRRDAGDPALELRLRAAGDHGHERVRHRRRGDRKPRVRLVGGHVARADGGGEVPLPRRQYQRHDRHGAARLGGAVDPDIARGLDSASVDLIVSGHTHSLVNTVVNGIPIVQARSSGAGIAVVDFVRLRGTKRQVRARIETPYTDQVRPDAALGDTLRVYQRAIETVRSRPVARVKVELRRTGQEYGLGRLIADAQRNVAQADVAIVNNGGIRADLAAGAVTYGDLYEVQPFQNRLVRLLATGKVLKEALEHVVAGDRADAHVSGLEVWYDPGKRAGRRVTKLTLADGRGVDDGRTYTVAVSDFLAAGGSGFTMLRGLPADDAGLVDLDALIRYLSELRSPVEPPADERIHRAR